tara:strand:+ start:775 stop:1221 length:447 start_codon:yes stop_codon:yes gene_type:complete
MSARANASAKARRAGGSGNTLETPTNNFENNSFSTTNSGIQTPQSISVKQAIVLLNSKLNNLSMKLNGQPTISNTDNIQFGTLELRVAELQKKNDLLTNDLATTKTNLINTTNDLEKTKKTIPELKDMLLKLQTSFTDLQSKVLKLKD